MRYLFIITCIACIFLNSSCKKEDSKSATPAVPVPCPAGSICAVVNGNPVTTSVFYYNNSLVTYAVLYYGGMGRKYSFQMSGLSRIQVGDTSIARYINITFNTNDYPQIGESFTNDTASWQGKDLRMSYNQGYSFPTPPYSFSKNYGTWLIDPAHPAKITIQKLDTVNKVISGTFSFNTHGDEIRVTDGEFTDVSLKTFK